MPDPDFPAKLQELISAYITNLRTHCDIPYSIDKLVSILSKLSIAHARLTHSHEVRDEDCVVAINLVEESMALVHDTSLFGFSSYDQDLENIQLGENEDVVGNAVESLEELMASVKELCGQGR